MSGETGGGPGIESGGTGVAVLEPPKTSPIPETPAEPKIPLELHNVDASGIADEGALDSDPSATVPTGPTTDTPDAPEVERITSPEKRDLEKELSSMQELLQQKVGHVLTKSGMVRKEGESDTDLAKRINEALMADDQNQILSEDQKKIRDLIEGRSETMSEQETFSHIDLVRQEILEEAEARGLLSGIHLISLTDNSELQSKLGQTAFIDNPELLAEVFRGIDSDWLDNVQSFLQEKLKVFSTRPELASQLDNIKELIKFIPKLKESLPKFIKNINIQELFADIAAGDKPELVKHIVDFSNRPDGVAEILRALSEDIGFSLDPNFFQRHGKTIGKVSLLAALGLMYALMKSGKEQPQGYQ